MHCIVQLCQTVPNHYKTMCWSVNKYSYSYSFPNLWRFKEVQNLENGQKQVFRRWRFFLFEAVLRIRIRIISLDPDPYQNLGGMQIWLRLQTLKYAIWALNKLRYIISIKNLFRTLFVLLTHFTAGKLHGKTRTQQILEEGGADGQTWSPAVAWRWCPCRICPHWGWWWGRTQRTRYSSRGPGHPRGYPASWAIFEPFKCTNKCLNLFFFYQRRYSIGTGKCFIKVRTAAHLQ